MSDAISLRPYRATQLVPPMQSGIVTFSPEHELVAFQPSDATDSIVADHGAVYVERYGVVHELTARGLERRWQLANLSVRAVALPAPRSPVVVIDGCSFHGALRGNLSGGVVQETVIAGSDNPRLRGPVSPLRVAAARSAWVLQREYFDTYRAGARSINSRASGSIQRWATDGQLAGQLNACPRGDAGIVDVTAEGDDTFTVRSEAIERYAAQGLPAGAGGEAMSVYRAADASGGRVAVLDVGLHRVTVFDRDLSVVKRYDLRASAGARPQGAVTPVDIAFAGNRFWLAEPGTSSIVGYDLAAGQIGTIDVPDAPVAVADGPDGSLFVLGSSGWAYRYGTDGRRIAQWPLPVDDLASGPLRSDETVLVSDIAVGPDGRVLVPYTRLGRAADITSPIDAGVWVFAPGDGQPGAPPGAPPGATPPPRTACIAAADKRAAPDRVVLGDAVEVTLRVTGLCPAPPAPHQIVFVVDTSLSMAYGSLTRAKAAATALLEALDPRVGQAGIVRFADEGIVAVPLTNAFADLRIALIRMGATGGTRFTAGIEAAIAELTGPRGNASAKRTIVLMTDGIPDDDPSAALAAARAAGLGIMALIYPSRTPQAQLDPVLRALLGNAPIHYDLVPERTRAAADVLRAYEPAPGLFEHVTIVDDLPDDMVLDAASVAPAAVVSGRTLTWSLGPTTAAEGVMLRYRVRPQTLGRRPTNVRAAADYRDAHGVVGRLDFPVPYIDVVAPPTATITPTPSATLSATAAPPSTHTPSPPPTATTALTPRPAGGLIFLPIAIREETVKRVRRTDVILILDASQSMAGAKLAGAKAAAGAFVDAVALPETRIGLVTFADHVVDALPPTADMVAVRRRIDAVSPSPGTRIDRALVAAGVLLDAGSDEPDREPVVVLLTDGRQSDEPATALAAAERLRAKGTEIWAVGLGADVDAGYLHALTGTPDRVRLAAGPAELVAVYISIARLLPCRLEDYWSRRCG